MRALGVGMGRRGSGKAPGNLLTQTLRGSLHRRMVWLDWHLESGKQKAELGRAGFCVRPARDWPVTRPRASVGLSFLIRKMLAVGGGYWTSESREPFEH